MASGPPKTIMRRRLTPTEEGEFRAHGHFSVKLAANFLFAMQPNVTYWLRFETDDAGVMALVAEGQERHGGL